MHTLDGYHGLFLTSPRFEHSQNRSLSVGPTQPTSTPKTVPRIKSSNALMNMAAFRSDSNASGPTNDSEESLSTIPDPRNASSSDLSVPRTPSPRHPDLSDEVAKLSDKLISAINHQTLLEDTLAQARHEVDTSRTRIQRLEAEAKAHEEQISSGMLLPKTDVDNEKSRLTADLATARKQKELVIQEKRGIESELETLTASLFEEANKMVAAANKERDVVERRNLQLRDQVKDTESLLANQQEQLTQLKIVMQQMGDGNEKDEGPESARNSTEPASPSSFREKDAHFLRLLDAMNLSPRSADIGGEISPAPSTTLTHLLKPVYRTDLPAYEDFRLLLLASQKSQPASRVTSGSYAGLSVMGLSALTSSSISPSLPPNNSSSTSLNANQNHSATTSPQLPGSFSPNSSTDRGPIPLKEVRFYKRILLEDIEPTLRLDLSPSISWLSRRSILSALAENGLIVEPIPEQAIKLYGRSTPCALCGEARKDIANPRTHRMRARDGEGATKWALCILCLEKIRATCDLVGYVRMIRDAVVRCADRDEEQEAWEELIRLRERLFWARMAGGVVPSFVERLSDKGSPIVSSSKNAGQEEAFADSKPYQSAPSSPSQPHHPHHQQPVTNDPSTNDPSTPTDSPSDPETAAASAQLHRNLSESMTTFDSDPSNSMPGIRDVTPKTPPRFPVREDRGGSWGNLKVNVPKAFTQVSDDRNVSH